MNVRQRCLLALIVLGTGAPFAPAQASLVLTPAGITAGFTLTNFLSGGNGYTFLGSANLPDGTLAVGGFAGGQIFKFNDIDGQTIVNALLNVSFAGEIDMATAGGQAYAASRDAWLLPRREQFDANTDCAQSVCIANTGPRRQSGHR